MDNDFITKAYKRATFTDFLSDFLPEDFKPEETSIYPDGGIQRIKEVIYLGHVESLDLDVFEFRHESENDPRVSLTHDASMIMKKHRNASTALAAFYSKDSDTWRFSLIFYGTKIEGSKVHREFSNPRRYSFILGKGCKRHTPESMLVAKGVIKDPEDLHNRFAVEVVTKEFYNKLFNWYIWATEAKTGVTFPNNTNIPEDDREELETKIIRLITRIIFVWFIKQKDLVPEILFNAEQLRGILKNFDPQSTTNGNYYNAILQNLFFATLNRAVVDEESKGRGFAEAKGTRDVKTLYRYAEMFSIPKNEVIKLFSKIPFLNGGLFECLDKTKILDGVEAAYNEDGFSRNPATFSNGKPKWRAFLPNMLFFAPENGLFSILNEYNFTVEENTPYDVDVSLDPELLGKVFENLLGAYNPETQESARKDSGSFYTPREIVNYMVDESLISYLGESEKIRKFVQTGETNGFSENEIEEIEKKLCTVKIFDPACGSGAFPMGLLNRIVDLSKKVNPEITDIYALKLNLIENCIYGSDIQQIAVQICKLRFFISLICECKKDMRKENFGINPLPNLETKFVCANSLIKPKFRQGKSELDFNNVQKLSDELREVRRKHFTAEKRAEKIELRKKDEQIRGQIVETLKKLGKTDTKEIKDAKSVLGYYQTIFERAQKTGDKAKIEAKEKEIKAQEQKISALYEKIDTSDSETITEAAALELAKWNPYDQNASSPFFDPEWMFGVANGFDIVIGNPPYIPLQDNGGKLRKQYQDCDFKCFNSMGDIYSLFYERGFEFLKSKATLCYITSNKWMRAGYGEGTRKFLSQFETKLLCDFTGVKVFENATVDVNILLALRCVREEKTFACILNQTGKNYCFKQFMQNFCRGNLSDYIRQKSSKCSFDTSEPWVILSPIEQSIKSKIEAKGTPLKKWDVRINYGIKTGFNDAFIINGEKRQEILNNCQASDERKRTDELIRPILRGRDIKRYGYEYANLYLIATFPAKHYDIDEFPAVKKFLEGFQPELNQTGQKLSGKDIDRIMAYGESQGIKLNRKDLEKSRKKTCNKWFETDSVNFFL